MPQLSIDGKTEELGQGEPLKAACETLGVPFGCEAGNCGTCVIIIESGMENLLPKSAFEEDMRLRPNERLACQARMGAGDVCATW